MRNVPEGFLQWCYSVMHWKDRLYVVNIQEAAIIYFESLLHRIIFVGKYVIYYVKCRYFKLSSDCYKPWRLVEDRAGGNDWWTQLIIFGREHNKIVTIWYHFSSDVRQDSESSRSYKVEFLFKAKLGFINNQNGTILQPYTYMTWNDPNKDDDDDRELHEDRLDQLYADQFIELSRHESYINFDTSFYMMKNEQDVQAIMNWIGCPDEISTRTFYYFLQAIMVKYKLSNHGVYIKIV